MPIYEYQCEECGHELEALQKMADAPLIECPSCRASALKKKVSAAAFRLKGSGWYETDFKSKNKKNLASSDSRANSSDSSGKASASGGGSETKSTSSSSSGSSSNKSETKAS